MASKKVIRTNPKERKGWRPGPWDSEPDYMEFEFLGFLCIMRRNMNFGNWCGYIRVPRLHPWYATSDESELNVPVHGGVTYAGPCFIGDDVDETTDPEYILIGFDCAHAGDVMPGYRIGGAGTYKDINFVSNELRNLGIHASKAGVAVEIGGSRTVLSLGLEITFQGYENALFQEFIDQMALGST